MYKTLIVASVVRNSFITLLK